MRPGGYTMLSFEPGPAAEHGQWDMMQQISFAILNAKSRPKASSTLTGKRPLAHNGIGKITKSSEVRANGMSSTMAR